MMTKRRVQFRSDFLPETIRFTSSDYLDFSGFCVQIRDMPDEGEGATGRRGRPYFSFGYRLFQEKGRRTVSFDQDPNHVLTTNRIVVLLPPHRPYGWSWHNAGGRLASFGVDPAFVEAVLGRAGLPARRLWDAAPVCFAINYPVNGLCGLLIDETQRGCPQGPRYFEHLGAALLIAIASQTDPRLPDACDLEAQHARLQPAIALMKAHFNSKLTLEQLAGAACLSAFHFSRLFHAAVGLAPCQYLWVYRLHRARLLLSVAFQARSIADVAAECGFADQSHLGRRFRLAYGMSPLEFRQEQQKAQAESKRAQAHPRRSLMAGWDCLPCF
jgi:AraC-like DNA-binding protein